MFLFCFCFWLFLLLYRTGYLTEPDDATTLHDKRQMTNVALHDFAYSAAPRNEET